MTLQLRRLILVLSGCLLVYCLLPFLILSFFSQIQADDFVIINELTQNGFTSTQLKWYVDWSGRYSAFAFVSLLLHYVYPILHTLSLVSFSIQLFFLYSAWYLFNSLFPKGSVGVRLFSFCLILLSYYWSIPSPAEAFYWISSSYSYQLGISLNMLFFGVLFRREYLKRTSRQFLLITLAALIPGTCEINIMVLGWGLLCILVWEYWNYKRIERKLAIIIITALCFSIVSVCAPGNQVRTTVLEGQSIGTPGNLIFAAQAAFLAAKNHIVDLFIKTPLLLFSSMFVWGINRSFKKPAEPVNGSLLIITGIAFCFAFLTFYLPFPYKTGDGIMPGRLLNVTAVFFLVGWYISLFLSWIYLSKLKPTVVLYPMLRIGWVMLIALFILQLRFPNRIHTAWSDLLTGNAIGYKTQIAARMRLFSNKQNQQVQVAPLVNIPTTLYFSDLDSNATDWKNVAYAKHYGLDRVSINLKFKP